MPHPRLRALADGLLAPYRLASVTQGTGADARTTGLGYDDAGKLTVVTDPLGRVVRFAYDAAGRPTVQTFPDGREVPAAYDAAGNLTGLTPPGRPAHTFAYTARNLPAAYVAPAPATGEAAGRTEYAYAADDQLTGVLRPGGQTVGYSHDGAGRPTQVTLARGAIAATYDAATGHLKTLTTPGGLNLAFAFDGALLTSETAAGPVAGTVARAYDDDLRLASQSVNGTAVSFGYDPDSLLTQAGGLTLTRDAQHGLVTGASLGGVTSAWTYDGFGGLATASTSLSSGPLYIADTAGDRLLVTDRSGRPLATLPVGRRPLGLTLGAGAL
jgi:YD repeat-containing protein